MSPIQSPGAAPANATDTPPSQERSGDTIQASADTLHVFDIKKSPLAEMKLSWTVFPRCFWPLIFLLSIISCHGEAAALAIPLAATRGDKELTLL